MITEPSRAACPRCGAERLRAWHELTADEREVVHRLPAAASQSLAERRTRHRWCVRCWHEVQGAAEQI